MFLLFISFIYISLGFNSWGYSSQFIDNKNNGIYLTIDSEDSLSKISESLVSVGWYRISAKISNNLFGDGVKSCETYVGIRHWEVRYNGDATLVNDIFTKIIKPNICYIYIYHTLPFWAAIGMISIIFLVFTTWGIVEFCRYRRNKLDLLI